MATCNIISEQVFDAADHGDARYLTALGGCSDYGKEYGLGDWQCQFEIEATNEGETKRFTVVFQPEERTNGMMNYAGWEVATASRNGCDADESGELVRFCDDDDTIVVELEARATSLAKAELEDLLGKLAAGDIEPNQDA